MSNIEGVRLPYIPNHGKTQRKMPAPFSRTSINLGGDPQTKRSWGHVLAVKLKAGDVVPGVGVLTDVVEGDVTVISDHCSECHHEDDPTVIWTVTVTGGDGNTKTFKGEEQVWAFTAPCS